MSKKHLTTVVTNTEISPGVHLLRLHAPELAKEARAGQFVHAHCGFDNHILLRRPLSVHGADRENGEIELLFGVVGAGTGYLSRLQMGQTADLLGPLGNGFVPEGERPLLIGGGLGVAPLRLLAQEFSQKGIVPTIVLGFNNTAEANMGELFSEWSESTHIATMDGTTGFYGTSCDQAHELLQNRDYDGLYVCGPDAMVKALPQTTAPVYVSLEAYMACGVGACLGCAVATTTGGFKHVCKDGPVFERKEVVIDG